MTERHRDQSDFNTVALKLMHDPKIKIYYARQLEYICINHKQSANPIGPIWISEFIVFDYCLFRRKLMTFTLLPNLYGNISHQCRASCSKQKEKKKPWCWFLSTAHKIYGQISFPRTQVLWTLLATGVNGFEKFFQRVLQLIPFTTTKSTHLNCMKMSQ